MPIAAGWVSQQSSAEQQGTYMGWYTMTYAIAFVISPLLFGNLYEHNHNLPWHFALAAGVFAPIGYLGLHRYQRTNCREVESVCASH